MIDVTPWVDLWPFALAAGGAVVLLLIVKSVVAVIVRLFVAATLVGVDWSRLAESNLDALPPWFPGAAHAVTALILSAWLLKSSPADLGARPARDQPMN